MYRSRPDPFGIASPPSSSLTNFCDDSKLSEMKNAEKRHQEIKQNKVLPRKTKGNPSSLFEMELWSEIHLAFTTCIGVLVRAADDG